MISLLYTGFSYSGQRCTAVKIVFATEDIADELLAKVGTRTCSLHLFVCTFRS